MADEIRIGDRERDEAVARLRSAFSEGRLDDLELEERLAGVYAAKTRSDLVPMTGDLPVPVVPAPVVAGNFLKQTSAIWGGPAGVCLTVTIIWIITTPTGYFWPIWVYLGMATTTGAALFAKWQSDQRHT
jgi:hypothetical protein